LPEEVVFIWKNCKLYYNKQDLDEFPIKFADAGEIQVTAEMFGLLEKYGRFCGYTA